MTINDLARQIYYMGYKEGETAQKDIQNWDEVITRAEEYNKGLSDAWECARKLSWWNAEYKGK